MLLQLGRNWPRRGNLPPVSTPENPDPGFPASRFDVVFRRVRAGRRWTTRSARCPAWLHGVLLGSRSDADALLLAALPLRLVPRVHDGAPAHFRHADVPPRIARRPGEGVGDDRDHRRAVRRPGPVQRRRARSGFRTRTSAPIDSACLAKSTANGSFTRQSRIRLLNEAHPCRSAAG